METLNNLAFGLGVALSWQNLLYCFIGCFLGTLVGVLPGHRAGGDGRHAAAVHLRAGARAGADHARRHLLRRAVRRLDHGDPGQHSGRDPRPSSPRSTATRWRGAAAPGPALGIAAIGSFIAGCIATLVVAYFAPPLAEIALKFGPAEYFSLMVFGLIAAVVLARGSLLKAIAMVCFGILLGLIGTDVNSGVIRFAFGWPELDRRASASSRSRWRSSASPT